MTKKQDSGLSCFMIVMKFHGIPITKEQAENLAVLDTEQKTGEFEIIQSAKALKMKAKLCRLKVNKLNNVISPVIAKGNDGEFFIIAKSQEDKFMILHTDKTAPEVISREELGRIWDGTAIIINKKGILDLSLYLPYRYLVSLLL